MGCFLNRCECYKRCKVAEYLDWDTPFVIKVGEKSASKKIEVAPSPKLSSSSVKRTHSKGCPVGFPLFC